jgi:membrane-bound ClpP family serine protease
MKKNEHINQWVTDALNSMDNAAKAQPRPYLFTRLTAKMHKTENSVWDNALRFLSRPAVAMVCIVLVLSVNALVYTFNQPTSGGIATDEQLTTTDDYSNAIAVLNDIENIEP